MSGLDTIAVIKDTIIRPVFTESVLAESNALGMHSFGLPVTEAIVNPDWFFYLLMGILVFLAWVRSLYGNVWLNTAEAVGNYAVTLRMYKDNSAVQKRLDNLLYLFYFISFAFYLLIIERHFTLFPYNLKTPILLLFNVAVLLMLFFARLALNSVIGNTFRQTDLFREYTYNVFVFNKLLGISIVPFLFLINYSTGSIRIILIWTSLVLVGAVGILRVMRGIVFSIKKDVSLFYLFLYLCALEILPILVLFKWIQSISLS